MKDVEIQHAGDIAAKVRYGGKQSVALDKSRQRNDVFNRPPGGRAWSLWSRCYSFLLFLLSSTPAEGRLLDDTPWPHLRGRQRGRDWLLGCTHSLFPLVWPSTLRSSVGPSHNSTASLSLSLSLSVCGGCLDGWRENVVAPTIWGGFVRVILFSFASRARAREYVDRWNTATTTRINIIMFLQLRTV
jgi:hypothetical protein